MIPIIHNLDPRHPAYEACQRYNTLITERPRGNLSLALTLAAQREWRAECDLLLDTITAILRKESLS